jgi:hypothetical protein
MSKRVSTAPAGFGGSRAVYIVRTAGVLLEVVRRVNPRASTASAPPRPWLPKIDLPAVGRIEITVRFLRMSGAAARSNIK